MRAPCSRRTTPRRTGPTAAGCCMAKHLLRSNVEVDQRRSIYDLATLERRFDIVLCLGVYYHLVDVFHALAQIRHCCHDDTIVVLEGDGAASGVNPQGTLVDLSNHTLPIFVPTTGALRHLCEAAYLRVESQDWMTNAAEYWKNAGPAECAAARTTDGAAGLAGPDGAIGIRPALHRLQGSERYQRVALLSTAVRAARVRRPIPPGVQGLTRRKRVQGEHVRAHRPTRDRADARQGALERIVRRDPGTHEVVKCGRSAGGSSTAGMIARVATPHLPRHAVLRTGGLPRTDARLDPRPALPGARARRGRRRIDGRQRRHPRALGATASRASRAAPTAACTTPSTAASPGRRARSWAG